MQQAVETDLSQLIRQQKKVCICCDKEMADHRGGAVCENEACKRYGLVSTVWNDTV